MISPRMQVSSTTDSSVNLTHESVFGGGDVEMQEATASIMVDDQTVNLSSEMREPRFGGLAYRNMVPRENGGNGNQGNMDPASHGNEFKTGSAEYTRPMFGNRRLYIGNISNEVTEEMLRDFFQENGFKPEAIGKVILRNGYAFVDCQDSATATSAAEKCNMKTFMNTVLRVEAAERPGFKPRGLGRQRSSTQIVVKNCSSTTNLKDVQTKFEQFGPVTVEEGLHPGSFVVHTLGAKQSDALIAEFHGKNLGGARLAVHSIYDGPVLFDGSGDAGRLPMAPNRNMPWKNNNNATPLMEMDFPRGTTIPASAYAAYQSACQAAAEPPLKILVPNEFVGAVIGRGGATIRSISKGTGARLDIFRNCSRYDVPEKPVTIYGPPEKASKACRRILEIIEQEIEHQQEEKGEVALRMFAQDSYIGRVIGKGGNIIKKIMDDTQTKIHISTQSDIMGKESSSVAGTNRHYVPPIVERLITIRGAIDGMCKAEEIISEKLREAYQNEIRMYENGYTGPSAPNASNFGSGSSGHRPYGGSAPGGDGEYVRPNGTGPTVRRKFNSRTPFTLSSSPGNGNPAHYIPGGTYSTYPSSQSAYLNSVTGAWNAENQSNLSRPETVNMYIPDDVVGALIGRKGSNIRQIIQQTGASVKIMEDTLAIDDNPVRRVVINGVIDSLFKAQYLIYDKVVEEGKGPINHQIDDIRLTVEMSVPSDMVGRLIGKNGQNIRDIQKNFLCRVKFMTEPDDTLPPGNPGETFVRITGNYNAFLGAQKQIREMLVKAMTRFFHGQISGNKRRDDSGHSGHSANTSGNSDEMSPTTGGYAGGE